MAYVLNSTCHDAQRWAATAIYNLTRDNPNNKALFGTGEIRDALGNFIFVLNAQSSGAEKAKSDTETPRVTTNTSIGNQTALGKLGLYKRPRDAGSGNQTEASAKRPK